MLKHLLLAFHGYFHIRAWSNDIDMATQPLTTLSLKMLQKEWLELKTDKASCFRSRKAFVNYYKMHDHLLITYYNGLLSTMLLKRVIIIGIINILKQLGAAGAQSEGDCYE